MVAVVVWLPWVIGGVIGLLEGVSKSNPSALPVLVKGHQVLSAVALSLGLLVNVTGVALIWYLLHLSGEGFAAIGWFRRVTRRDLAAMFGLFLAIFALTAGIGAIVNASGLPDYQYGDSPHLPAYFLLPGYLGAIAAGVGEETVVAGYLLLRLDQLGVPRRRAILISASARAAYHIYYGFGALIMLAVGVLFAWRWYRTRRLWRLAGSHTLWDAFAFTLVVATS